ncbi:MAG: prepilin-type N-terminal cleavage/methylation domain-containing protein [Chthoniobacterales bacterium]
MTTQTQVPTRSKLLIKARKAFSLVELLVVIAVIGIIAAIAIPNISGITGSANIAKDQRNAQNIASVFSAAQAAGDLTVYADTAAAVAAVTGNSTISVTNGTITNFFAVPNLTPNPAVLGYLNYTPATRQLSYNPAAPAPTP